MTTDSRDRIVLHQFRTSNFSEKARWALDFKRLPYQIVNYIPGAHEAAIRTLSGQTTAPVLQTATQVVIGSAAIIEFLDRKRPDPALYPFRVTDRSRALEVQRSWDLQMGPAARLLLFASVAAAMDSAANKLVGDDATDRRRRYRAALAFLGGVTLDDPTLGEGVYWPVGTDDPAKVRAACDSVSRGLDWLAANINADGQLITPGFTVADLTCAALLTPLIEIPHPALVSPVTPPAPVLALRKEYQQHPAVHWVQMQYKRHRRPTNLV